MTGLARNTARTFATRLITVGMGFVISVLTARGLGPEYKGVNSFWCLMLGMAAIVSTLGIDNAAEYFISSRRRTPREALDRILPPFLLSLFPLLLIGCLIAWWFQPPGAEHVTIWIVLIAALILAAELAGQYAIAFLHGLREFDIWNAANLAAPAILLVCLALAFVFLPTYTTDSAQHMAHPGFTFFLAAFSAYALSRYVLVIPGLVLLKRRHGLFRGMRLIWDGAYLRESLDYGLRYYPSTVLSLLIYRLDMIFVWYLVGEAGVGIYSIASLMAELIWHLPDSARMVLFPELAGARQESERTKTQNVCRLSLVLMALGCIGAAVLAPWVIPWVYSQDFAGAVVPLWILLPGTLVYGLTVVLRSDVAARGRPELASRTLALAVLTNAILNAPLILALNLAGAALSSTISYTVASIYLVRAYAKLSGASWRDLVLPRKADFLLFNSAIRHVLGRQA